MKKWVLISVALLLIAGCASMSQGPVAVAKVGPVSGSSVSGTVRFTQMADNSVEVAVHLAGVPEGVHGFHIHEKGDCGDNGNAAGGHFNPTAVAHGAPNATPHHGGDFGNVTAAPNGTVNATFTTTSITVSPGPLSVVGRGVILHANPDDLVTQPTGNAGGRIACGVIELH